MNSKGMQQGKLIQYLRDKNIKILNLNRSKKLSIIRDEILDLEFITPDIKCLILEYITFSYSATRINGTPVLYLPYNIEADLFNNGDAIHRISLYGEYFIGINGIFTRTGLTKGLEFLGVDFSYALDIVRKLATSKINSYKIVYLKEMNNEKRFS